MAEKEGFARLRAGRLGLQGAPGALPSALGSNPSEKEGFEPSKSF